MLDYRIRNSFLCDTHSRSLQNVCNIHKKQRVSRSEIGCFAIAFSYWCAYNGALLTP